MIDVHTHFMKEDEWSDEWQDHWHPAYGHPWPEVEPSDYDHAMRDAQATIVFGIRATRVGVKTPNERIAEFCRATSGTTIGFMALDLSDDDVGDQLEDGLALGLRGIKLYPVLAGFSPDDPQFDPFYRRVADLGIPILWHMGTSPSAAGDLSLSTPLLIDQVAGRHPELTQIIAHLAHPWQRETIIVLRRHRRVFADVSGLWARPMDGYLALVRAQEWHVVDKLLFGSDYPLWTPDAAVGGLRSLASIGGPHLPRVEDATIEGILNRDALSLLGLRS